MPQYKITDPTTNKSLTLTGDSPPTEQELNDIFSKVHGDNPANETKPGLLSKVYDSLNVPSEMARSGLNQLASYVPSKEPTGNMVSDIALNVPKVAAETVAQVAPNFIDRTSILTGGVLGAARAATPLIKTAGSLVGKGAEALSGLEHQTPGILTEAAKDATLIFSKGKSAAGDLYKAAKDGSSFNLFDGLYKPDEIVDMARTYINKGGALQPTEALMYRKAVDKLLKSGKYVKDELFTMRQEADQIAKQSDLIAQADPMYVRGMRAEALRNLLPQNKLGGSSAFKSAIAAAMKAAGIITLPIVQGATATGLGLATRGASALAGPTVRSATGMGSLLGSSMGLLKNEDNQ